MPRPGASRCWDTRRWSCRPARWLGALQLRREPTRPYDTRVEVWLDPARQHLPVRAVFTTLPGGEPLQLELAALDRGLEIDAGAPR